MGHEHCRHCAGRVLTNNRNRFAELIATLQPIYKLPHYHHTIAHIAHILFSSFAKHIIHRARRYKNAMSENLQSARTAKRPRLGERTMLACTYCKGKKLKVKFLSPPLFPKRALLTICSATAKLPSAKIVRAVVEVSQHLSRLLRSATT